MSKTTIEWTERVWNPVTGCTKVSPGCLHCYAEGIARRFQHDGPFVPWTVAAQRKQGADYSPVYLHHERLKAPLHWRKPCRIFVNSMSDLFHEMVPSEFVDQVFAVMMLAERHTFQVLTKRPERMLEYLTSESRPVYWHDGGVAPRPASTPTKVLWQAQRIADDGFKYETYPTGDEMEWPLPNVWLGVSVENQRWADTRLPILAHVPTKVRFVSAEPLLGPLDLKRHLYTCACGQSPCVCKELPLISWVIAGGESGPGHRVADPAWFASLRDQCQAAGVLFFMKQDSGSRPGTQGRIPDDVWACKEMPV